MFGGPEVSYHRTYSARDWLPILRTPYPTQNLQRLRTYGSKYTKSYFFMSLNVVWLFCITFNWFIFVNTFLNLQHILQNCKCNKNVWRSLGRPWGFQNFKVPRIPDNRQMKVYILTIKTNEMYYFSNWFWYRTVHVSGRFIVHHQESSTVYTAIGICHTGYAVYTVLDSWWWTVTLSETCRVLHQNNFEK